MAKDTTRLSHADYVVGARNANSLRHAAAVSQPHAGPTRAERRANMTVFRTARHVETKRAETIAAFRAAPAPFKPTKQRTITAPVMGVVVREVIEQRAPDDAGKLILWLRERAIFNNISSAAPPKPRLASTVVVTKVVTGRFVRSI
jgi:biotin carboxyl carrier protein